MTGIEMTHVPYKGSLPALNDVVAGHVPLMFVDFGPALPLIQAGKVRALGVTTAKRSGAAARYAAARRAVPGFGAASWQMVAAPARTPRPSSTSCTATSRACSPMPEIKEQIVKTGMVPMDEPAARRAATLRHLGDRALGQGRRAGRHRRFAIAGRPLARMLAKAHLAHIKRHMGST